MSSEAASGEADSAVHMSDLQRTLQAVAMPPLPAQLGTRVEHLTFENGGLLSQLISDQLHLPASFILELMRFGAVHHCAVTPLPAPAAAQRLPPEQLERIRAAREAALARWGCGSQHQTPRRTLTDAHAAPGSYARVHVHPKRFPAAHAADWRRRVVSDAPRFVVVDKPSGVQVAPTVDNVLECVPACVERALGLCPGALLVTHRLDAGTSGLLVLARDVGFARWWAHALEDKAAGRVRKVYRCVTRAPPPVGTLLHWALLEQRRPGEPAHTLMLEEQVEGSFYCELRVLQVEQVRLVDGAAPSDWEGTGFEAQIELITGRTHQIRAQLAAIGCPLLGDLLYQALLARRQQEGRQQPGGLAQPEGQQQLPKQQQRPVLSLPEQEDGQRHQSDQQHHEQQQQQQREQQQQQQQHEQRQQQLRAPPGLGSSSSSTIASDTRTAAATVGSTAAAAASSRAPALGTCTGSSAATAARNNPAELERDAGGAASACGGGTNAGGARSVATGRSAWGRAAQDDPLRPIGLQAAELHIQRDAGREDMLGDCPVGRRAHAGASGVAPPPRLDAAAGAVGWGAEGRGAWGGLGCGASGVSGHSPPEAELANPGACEEASWVVFQAGVPWWRDFGASPEQ